MLPLPLIKLVHTLIWAFMVACIAGIPYTAHTGRWSWAAFCSVMVLGECLVLVFNRMRCPLTDLAARHTDERHANFDIYLPLWLARHNQLIFGSLWILGSLYALILWMD